PDDTRSTRASGLLTQESNIGNIEDNEFSNFSELGVSLHHRMNCGVMCSVGYSFMYWSDVLRAGNSIDSVLNPTQIPPNQLVGDARPVTAIDYESFYAQGLRLGIEFGY
ncbi:BBP7 family outer membrane beta-barrel protein, partial [Planctomycetota bacterium]